MKLVTVYRQEKKIEILANGTNYVDIVPACREKTRGRKKFGSHTHTHKHTRARARVCVCVDFRPTRLRP